jgi:hypothetical protein
MDALQAPTILSRVLLIHTSVLITEIPCGDASKVIQEHHCAGRWSKIRPENGNSSGCTGRNPACFLCDAAFSCTTIYEDIQTTRHFAGPGDPAYARA